MGPLYCAGLTYGTSFLQNIYTIFFIIFLAVLFFLNLQKINRQEKGPFFIIIQMLLLNLSIAITAQILISSNAFFWVQDVQGHLPESLMFTDFIKNHSQVIPDLGFHQGKSTHALTGLSIAIFGINTFATILAQLIFKIIAVVCIYFIGKTLWSKKVGLIAIQLYGFCPTIFFYTIVLYKEAAVQAFLAASILFTLKIFLEKKYLFTIPLIITLALLLGERGYITYLLLLMFPFLIYNLSFEKNKKNNLIFFFSGLITLLASYIYKPQLFSYTNIANDLMRTRNLYSSYLDVVGQYNYQIPYPLALLKITFTPFFTINKFEIFSDFSDLLIWGSFINQIIIFSALLGLIRAAKQKILHLYLWIPFFVFLLFAAYVSPFSGRIRDSFYPLISCYAAYYLANNKYFKKTFNI
jgi:4-amino-4-deoxy-L-arabinose transferase-like glycosyltransferase